MERTRFYIPFFFLLLVFISYSFVDRNKITEFRVIKLLESVQGNNPSLEMNPYFGTIPLYFIPN